MTKKTSSSFTICHIFALEINSFLVLLTVRALLARSPKRNKRKVVSDSRVTLPENFAGKPELSFNPLARVTLAVGLPYLLVNRALDRRLRCFEIYYNNPEVSVEEVKDAVKKELEGPDIIHSITSDVKIVFLPYFLVHSTRPKKSPRTF